VLQQGQKERSVSVSTSVEREDLERKRAKFLWPLSLGERETDILVTCSDATTKETGIFEQ